MAETGVSEIHIKIGNGQDNIVRIIGLVGNTVSNNSFRRFIRQTVRQKRLYTLFFIIREGKSLIRQRSKLQRVCQYIVKLQHPHTFGLGRIQRHMILLDLITPCSVKLLFQWFSLSKYNLARCFAILGDEPLDFVNVSIKPAMSLCIDQFEKLPMQVAEITPELPLLLRSGSFLSGILYHAQIALLI